jgi:parallel beta-helix repeat protein
MVKNKLFLFGLCLAPVIALGSIPVMKMGQPLLEEKPNQEIFAAPHLAVPEFGTLPATASSIGKKYYVDSAKGNDSSPGTSEAKAFKTIQQANQKVAAGDTVYVKNGTYNENLIIKTSGQPNRWITFQAFPGHRPYVIGSQEAFRIEANYIKIIGFEITSKVENGIVADGKQGVSHHIQILKNVIHDSGCNGIGASRSDYLLIEGNTTFRNAFTAPWQCSGISIYHAVNFDDKPGFHNVIRGNISYANENKVPQSGGQVVTDGNGIIVDDFRYTQKEKNPQPNYKEPKYRASTLVENNIVFDNGGRGIHVFQSDKVVVRNNTAFHNLRSNNLVGDLNAELNASFSDGSVFYNNIAYARDKSKATFVDNNSKGNRWDYNLSYNGVVKVGKDRSNAVLGKNNLINVDPLFVNPSIVASKGNFRLKSNSPALNSGTAKNAARTDIEYRQRPIGNKYDRGAYEMKF